MNYPKNKKEYEILESTGLLWELFPEAGGNFNDFKKHYKQYKYDKE